MQNDSNINASNLESGRKMATQANTTVKRQVVPNMKAVILRSVCIWAYGQKLGHDPRKSNNNLRP